MKETIETREIFERMVTLRRELHKHPEVGFDLPQTVKTVEDELREAGVDFTESYGKSSVVAEIGTGEKTVAVRADTDALPIEEKTCLPYSSENKGMMHACGHDSHTAVLLGLARYLKAHEKELKTKVRLIFQPSEEGAVSGAKMLVENSVMDGVDHIIGTHCEPGANTGEIAVCRGDFMAACVPLRIVFTGRCSHATAPKAGIDAIEMANEAYVRLKKSVAELAGMKEYIWSVGVFRGGEAHNVIAENCRLEISFRFYDNNFAEEMRKTTFSICEDIAASFGGKVDIDWHLSTPAVHNDERVTNDFVAALKAAGNKVVPLEKKMGSEDFGWYLTKSPGMIFRFGTNSGSGGFASGLHTSDFCPDEKSLKYAFSAFADYLFSL